MPMVSPSLTLRITLCTRAPTPLQASTTISQSLRLTRREMYMHHGLTTTACTSRIPEILERRGQGHTRRIQAVQSQQYIHGLQQGNLARLMSFTMQLQLQQTSRHARAVPPVFMTARTSLGTYTLLRI